MNFCTRIVEAAARHPERVALTVPRATDHYASSERVTYAQLLQQATRWQQALHAHGLQPGDRVLVLARPGVALYALMLALLGDGLVPVLIDRGMSRARILASIRLSGASAVVGERQVLRLWWLFPPLWRLPRLALDGAALGVRDLRNASVAGTARFQCRTLADNAHGLITFTTGSTGQPKGADRTHASLIAQHLAIRAHWPDQDDDIDAPCFPVLVLHNLCCGIRTVLPATDLAHPGQVDASRVLAQLRQEQVTRIACAPAYLERLVSACLSEGRGVPTLRSLVVGGSTLTERLVRDTLQAFPQVQIRAVYGSTEAEPIAEVDLPELLRDWEAGVGHLVGHPAAQTEVCIVNPDAPLTSDADVAAAGLADGEAGEILVAGAHVLQGYIDNPTANRETKVPRAQGGVWHRTGDAGYRDAQGRLWLVGRIKDAVQVEGLRRYTFDVEKALDALPGIRRSALIAGLTPQSAPLLVVEGDPDDFAALRGTLHVHGLRGVGYVRIEQMSVDGRHNSKIDRPRLLALLAKGKLRAVQIL